NPSRINLAAVKIRISGAGQTNIQITGVLLDAATMAPNNASNNIDNHNSERPFERSRFSARPACIAVTSFVMSLLMLIKVSYGRLGSLIPFQSLSSPGYRVRMTALCQQVLGRAPSRPVTCEK